MEEERSFVQFSPSSILTPGEVSSPDETIKSEEYTFHTSPVKCKDVQFPGQQSRTTIGLSVFGDYAGESNFENTPFDRNDFLDDITSKIAKAGSGMACLVRDGENSYLYSCMHNFETELDVNLNYVSIPGTHEDAMGRVSLPFLTMARLPNRDDTGEEYELRGGTQQALELQQETVVWHNGFEVVRFRIPNDAVVVLGWLRDHAMAKFFDLPDQNFQYVEGMKVAICEWDVIYTEDGGRTVSRPEHCGEQGNRNIFTGKIKIIGTKHIECDYNSFPGCSGGPVVCMDPAHEAHMGKVIAIHVGCKSEFMSGSVDGYNVAFKIATPAVQELISNSTVEEVREELTRYFTEHTKWINRNKKQNTLRLRL